MCFFLKLVYIGSKKTIRGIPVNEWQTCTYSKAERKTSRITFSYSSKKLAFELNQHFYLKISVQF